MDELVESLDKLNTNAKEWTPGVGIARSTSTQSDGAIGRNGGYLNKMGVPDQRVCRASSAAASWHGVQLEQVKEFVPKASSTASTSTTSTSSSLSTTQGFLVGGGGLGHANHSPSSSGLMRNKNPFQQQAQFQFGSASERQRSSSLDDGGAYNQGNHQSYHQYSSLSPNNNRANETHHHHHHHHHPASQDDASHPSKPIHDTHSGISWWAGESTSLPVRHSGSLSSNHGVGGSGILGSVNQQQRPTTVQGRNKRRGDNTTMRNVNSVGVAEELWSYYRDRSLELQREMEPTDPRIRAVPSSFGHVSCLDAEQHENGSAMKAGSFGYPSSVFKVISKEDGLCYCLRRLDNVKCISHRIAATVTERWADMEHPALASLRSCFLLSQLRNVAFFVHDYCPGATSLQEYVLSAMDGAAGGGEGGAPPPLLSERRIWSYVTQIVALLRYLHGRGMACRCLDPNHILVTDGQGRRLKVSSVGVKDALEYEARKPIGDLQMEDMASLGRLIFFLATRTVITKSTDADTMSQADAFVAQNFSPELHNLAISLLGNFRQPPPTIFDVSGMISHHAWEELDVTRGESDAYENELSAEYDCGRAMRLLLKLGFVNERPEFGMDRRWSETGDRYVLKLFRDYVFHQADASGQPVMDLSHVATALNKLDAADPEKVTLVSRDGSSLLVVSFADVARCLEDAYDELCGSEPSQTSAPTPHRTRHGTGGHRNIYSGGIDDTCAQQQPIHGHQMVAGPSVVHQQQPTPPHYSHHMQQQQQQQQQQQLGFGVMQLPALPYSPTQSPGQAASFASNPYR